MRTNNFSSRKNLVKAVAFFTLLFTCFVFVFALTLSSAKVLDGEDVVFADDYAYDDISTSNPTALSGDHGNPYLAEAGLSNFKLNDAGTHYVWSSYIETFENTTFSISNVSTDNNGSGGIMGIGKSDGYNFTGSKGSFSWETQGTGDDIIQLAVVNYSVPNIFKTFAGYANVTVTAKLSASISRESGDEDGYGITASTGKGTASSVSTSVGDKTTSVASNSTYLQLKFYGKGHKKADGLINGMVDSAKNSKVTISSINVKFTVEIKKATFEAGNVVTERAKGNTAVVDGVLSNGNWDYSTTTTFDPYITTSAQSTWPVWFENLTDEFNYAKDSFNGTIGKFSSYTNKSKTVDGITNVFKTSELSFVGTYKYTFNNDSGTGYDAKTSFAMGLAQLDVGDVTRTTENDVTTVTGAGFDISAMNGGAEDTKEILIDDVVVGKVKVTKVSKSKITLKLYIFMNADISVQITTTGYRPSTAAFSLNYSGIDPLDNAKPEALELRQNSNYTTSAIDNLGDEKDAATLYDDIEKLNWIREDVGSFAFETNVEDELEGNAPRVWFYTVDKVNALEDFDSIAIREFSNYTKIRNAIKYNTGTKGEYLEVANGAYWYSANGVYVLKTAQTIPDSYKGHYYTKVDEEYEIDDEDGTYFKPNYVLKSVVAAPEDYSGKYYDFVNVGYMLPFAYDSLSDFVYDFENGGVWFDGELIAGGIKSGNIVRVSGSGYYRFVFYTMDLAGNHGTNLARTTFYAKVDAVEPTFKVVIKYEDDQGSYSITENNGKNGTWTKGLTQVNVSINTKLSDGTKKSGVFSNYINLSGNTFSLNPSDERYFYQSIIEKNALENIPDADKYDAQDISNLSKAIVEQTRMMSANFFNVPPQMIVDILPPAPDQPLLTEAFLRAEPGSTLDRNVKSGIAAALSVAVKKNPLLSSALAPSSIIGNAYIGVEGIKSAVIAGDFSQGLSEIDPQLSRPSPAL